MKMLRNLVGYMLVAAMIFAVAPVVAGRGNKNNKSNRKCSGSYVKPKKT